MSKAGGGISATGAVGAFSFVSAPDHAGHACSGGCSKIIGAPAAHA